MAYKLFVLGSQSCADVPHSQEKKLEGDDTMKLHTSKTKRHSLEKDVLNYKEAK